VPFTPPTAEDLAALFDLAEDLIESWAAGTTDEFFDYATDMWQWNEVEVGGASAPRVDWRISLSALAATVCRFKRPRDPLLRRRYRNYAVRSIDAFFRDNQDPVTGGMFWTDSSQLNNESGHVVFFGFLNVATVVRCLGDSVKSRWATQIADAVDYSSSVFENFYYTNGNFMPMKLVAYELAAYVTDDPDRRQEVEDLWEFTYTPTVAVANPLKWRGCGYIEDSPGVGYFSEVVSTNSATDHTGTNRFDAIYTNAQAIYFLMGYTLFGDERYLDAARACTNKMLPLYDDETNSYTYTGGSRNAGEITRVTDNIYVPIGAWLHNDSEMASRVDSFIYNSPNGLDAYLRQYLNVSNPIGCRMFSNILAQSIIAAHGRVFGP
jgi:hypothetical protein